MLTSSSPIARSIAHTTSCTFVLCPALSSSNFSALFLLIKCALASSIRFSAAYLANCACSDAMRDLSEAIEAERVARVVRSVSEERSASVMVREELLMESESGGANLITYACEERSVAAKESENEDATCPAVERAVALLAKVSREHLTVVLGKLDVRQTERAELLLERLGGVQAGEGIGVQVGELR